MHCVRRRPRSLPLTSASACLGSTLTARPPRQPIRRTRRTQQPSSFPLHVHASSTPGLKQNSSVAFRSRPLWHNLVPSGHCSSRTGGAFGGAIDVLSHFQQADRQANSISRRRVRSARLEAGEFTHSIRSNDSNTRNSRCKPPTAFLL